MSTLMLAVIVFVIAEVVTIAYIINLIRILRRTDARLERTVSIEPCKSMSEKGTTWQSR